MAPVQSKSINNYDPAATGLCCPKTLCDLIKSVENHKVNPELGISLDEVTNGGLRHRLHKGNMKRSFFKFLTHDDKYAPYMDPFLHGSVYVPRLIASCMPDMAGPEEFKTKLVNEMLVDFAAGMKLSKPKKDGCPYLQPSTQCQYLCTLLTTHLIPCSTSRVVSRL